MFRFVVLDLMCLRACLCACVLAFLFLLYGPQEFAKARGATYPVLAKVDVNGFGTIPLYKFLKDKQGGGLGISAIKWNFTKYVGSIFSAGSNSWLVGCRVAP